MSGLLFPEMREEAGGASGGRRHVAARICGRRCAWPDGCYAASRSRLAVPPHGHARRLPDVGRHDQLRTGGLGFGSQAATATTPWIRTPTPAWPPIPAVFERLAAGAAQAAGFPDFAPDVCLINRYEPGAKLSLHQDKDEHDFSAPIVSVSLGLPAVFLLGGLRRSDRPRRIRLESGDVVVWGGPARLVYHGVAPLADGEHPLTGRCRINLTFRKAL